MTHPKVLDPRKKFWRTQRPMQKKIGPTQKYLTHVTHAPMDPRKPRTHVTHVTTQPTRFPRLLSTKFQHQEIRWNYGILRNEICKHFRNFLVNNLYKDTLTPGALSGPCQTFIMVFFAKIVNCWNMSFLMQL